MWSSPVLNVLKTQKLRFANVINRNSYSLQSQAGFLLSPCSLQMHSLSHFPAGSWTIAFGRTVRISLCPYTISCNHPHASMLIVVVEIIIITTMIFVEHFVVTKWHLKYF